MSRGCILLCLVVMLMATVTPLDACFGGRGGGSGSGSSPNYLCYGDLTLLNPTGASLATAGQDGLSYSGVRASKALVGADLSELNNLRSCYDQVGRDLCLEPALVAALASRESRGGRLLRNTNGWGDNHNAYGILQCDVRTSGLGSDCTKYLWNSCAHMKMMVERVFLDKVGCVQRDHSTWSKERQLQGGVAAYNFGCTNVQTWSGLDRGSTGNDYSNDVMARAQALKDNHGW